MNQNLRQDARSSRALWGAGLILVGILLGFSIPRLHREAGAQEKNATSSEMGESPFVSVAEEVLPAVVSVESKRIFQHPPVAQDSTSDEFSPFDSEGQIEMPSSGSGFLFDPDGYILTNNHVVEGARSIHVRLADGRGFAATIVGTDPPTDVAVVKIEGEGPFPVVPLGDSDGVRIGEWVAAVGNPLGVLEGSLTVGVVSAKKRHEIAISGTSPAYQDFIQTDAAINFGNSGGPLVNTRGEAVGMNTAFGGPGRGLGFAVSINMAKEVAKSLMSSGRVARGYLGVGLQPLDPNLVEGLKLKDGRGVLVRDVQPDTPAARAGLRSGDVILSFDGKTVDDLTGFQLMVARAPVGPGCVIRFLRDGEEQQLRVVLAERPDFDGSSAPASLPEVKPELGLELGLVSDQGELGDGGDSAVVVVKRVTTGSLAGEAGLTPGDLILQADGKSASDPDSCLGILQRAQLQRRVTILKIQRDGGHWFIAVPPVEEAPR